MPERPIRFGFLGLATREKGFDAFVAAARALKPKHGNAVEFHALGRFPPSAAADVGELQNCLATLPSREPIPRQRFDAAVASLHYVCLPYRADHYTLSASGVLVDALAFAKPILAGATPAVRELFADASPGMLLDDPDHLPMAIEQTIGAFTEAAYADQVAQVRRASARRSLERLAVDYRAIVANSQPG